MGAMVRKVSANNLILKLLTARMSFVLKIFPVILLTQIVLHKGV